VKSSVPHLLQGIRTSFWVSVSGIGWALTIKIRYVMFGDAALPKTGSATSATVDDLATQLIALNSAVSGTGDASLTSQTKLSRSDSNERFERLLHAFEAHNTTTTEANTQALVRVLSDVVRDFNTKVNDQFGENFKQLNLGVERLVTWQVQYEQQLISLTEREAAMSKSMSDASLRFAELVENSSVFVGTVSSIGTLLNSLGEERERLTEALTILAGLVDGASKGLPNIEKTIVDMTNQIARGVQTNQEMMGSVLKSSWQSIQVHNQHLTAMLAKSLEAAHKDTVAHRRTLDEDTQRVA